jgi:hypothetical protein
VAVFVANCGKCVVVTEALRHGNLVTSLTALPLAWNGSYTVKTCALDCGLSAVFSSRNFSLETAQVED